MTAHGRRGRGRGVAAAVATIAALCAFIAPAGEAPAPARGGIALQFDDGWENWRALIAPELKRVGGKATGFVNNMNLKPGRLTLEDLRSLQDDYGWEIGSHGYHHYRAPFYVQQHGVDKWVAEEFTRSVDELEAAGLRVRSLVFPYNVSTPELRAAVRKRVDSLRIPDALALVRTVRADGELPGTAFDLTAYVPPAMLRQWIDLARRQDQVLCLYGHRVLEDAAFTTGRVVRIESGRVVLDGPVAVTAGEELVLIPDRSKRSQRADPVRVLGVEGSTVTVPESIDLAALTRPGAGVIIGPMYGLRLSDFRELIEYAAGRVPFYTVSEVVKSRRVRPPPQGPAAD